MSSAALICESEGKLVQFGLMTLPEDHELLSYKAQWARGFLYLPVRQGLTRYVARDFDVIHEEVTLEYRDLMLDPNAPALAEAKLRDNVLGGYHADATILQWRNTPQEVMTIRAVTRRYTVKDVYEMHYLIAHPLVTTRFH